MIGDPTTILEILEELEELIMDATRVPFTAGRLVNEQLLFELIDKAREQLPKDVVEANDIIINKKKIIFQANIK